MELKQMFKRDITRDIKGVIVIGEDQKIKEELDEYVVTKEIAKHLGKFYQNYTKGIDGKTERMAVWISGFFGSGKSHFLKMLSYILSDEVVDGKKPVEYFKNKIEDPMLYADMERCSRVNTETILFNIDSKNPDKDKTNAILYTFLKVFNEHRGFSGEKPGLAEFEKSLCEEGIYEEFKCAFQKITGRDWLERRNAYKFDVKKIVQALVEVSDNITKESALGLINNINDYQVSIEDFATEVKKYIDKKDENYHLVFLVDEVGQFIGDNSDLMINLQTITEDLRKKCDGRVWVVVTAQESIDDILKVKGDDFSKIQGRFDTKLSLSSVSVDEVIKKRILDKTPQAVIDLKELYSKEEYNLKNLIKFEDGRSDLLGYANENEFVEVYPFIPYQFNLLQSVFEQVRKHGNSGKHLSKGERSMLEAFQKSAEEYLDKSGDILIPFDAFYGTISQFLNPTITRVITRAENNPALKDDEMNPRVLKTLFMLKYIGEIPENIDNITTLLITDINEKRSELEPKVRESLRKLEKETLIQKDTQNEKERYIFLTDDEQDVSREIKDITLDDGSVRNEIGGYIFDEIYAIKKYRYKDIYDFDINRKIDGEPHKRQIGNFGIHILSHNSSNYNASQQELMMKSKDNNEVIVRLGNNDKYVELLEEALKIDSYIKKKDEAHLPTNIKNIINNKKDEIRGKKNRAKELIEVAIKDAEFIVNGNIEEIKGSTVRERLNNALEKSTKIVYKRIDEIKKNLQSEGDIEDILNPNFEITFGDTNFEEVNASSIKDVMEYIKLMSREISLKDIMDRYTQPIYGWKMLDIQGIVAVLYKNQEIKIRHNGKYLNIADYKKITKTLTTSSEKENLMISVRDKVDAKLIRSTKNAAYEIFEDIKLPDDEDLLAVEIKKSIENELQEIKVYIAKYDGKKYPGKSIFEKGIAIFEQFKYDTDNIVLFKKLVKLEEEILDWKEVERTAKTFFANQRDWFDLGLRTLNKYNNNKDEIQNIKLEENISKLKDIIEDPIPYKKIRNIQDLVNAVESSLNGIIQEKREEAIAEINEIKNNLLEKTKEEGVTLRTKQTIEEFYQRHIGDISKFIEIYRINSARFSCSTKKPIHEATIERDIANFKKQQELETGSSKDDKVKETPEPEKKVEQIKISNIVNRRLLLSNNDVEEYVKVLEKELKRIIKEDKEIQIID
ncbi:MAG: BREX system P-loop protein BrxC [Terrisporobacter sp.]|uniref:BREX system P-loop protein BrxC n=1 Tax=Terrisporobacter sp. TaxID=1965305 RepID=UPI002FC9BA58